MSKRPLPEADSARPPRVTDRRWLERWRDAQPVPPAERWAAFAARDDLPATSFAFAASAVYSSNIEGVDLDLGSFLESKTRDLGPAREKARAEVAALEAAYAFAHDHDLTEAHWLRAHGLAAATLLGEAAGRYREGRVGVYGAGGLVYLAVEPEHVAEEMAGVFADVAALLADDLAPDEALYHAALLHLVTAHVHPFADGNGRAARLLEKWFLAGVLGEAAWAVPSEYHYWMHRPHYYAALRLGVDFYNLDYDRGGPDETGALAFFSMLPDALKAT